MLLNLERREIYPFGKCKNKVFLHCSEEQCINYKTSCKIFCLSYFIFKLALIVLNPVQRLSDSSFSPSSFRFVMLFLKKFRYSSSSKSKKTHFPRAQTVYLSYFTYSQTYWRGSVRIAGNISVEFTKSHKVFEINQRSKRHSAFGDYWLHA